MQISQCDEDECTTKFRHDVHTSENATILYRVIQKQKLKGNAVTRNCSRALLQVFLL